MPDSRYIAKVRRRKTFWNNVTRVVIQLFVWTGAAVLYYFAFSIFFDTPVEYRLKHSTGCGGSTRRSPGGTTR